MPRSPSENKQSFTENGDFRYDEAILVRNAKDIPTPNLSDDDEDTSVFGLRSAAGVTRELVDTDGSEDDASAFVLTSKQQSSPKLPRQQSSSVRPPSAGPSHRRTSLRSQSPAILDIQRLPEPAISDSDSEETHGKTAKTPIPGEYDARLYENLNVNEEIKEVFQYITKYVPQQLNLDFKFKPFVPEYLPAVGDIDAFLKVLPPETTFSGNAFDSTKPHLGLLVLDEPAANQSDPALLHLRLRSASVHSSSTANVIVKKVEDVAKNGKIVDKWMKDISDLHKTKSSPVVKYPDPVPNLDDLMQEWPENMENLLKHHGFPSSKFSGSLSQYIDVVCSIFDVPVYKNKIFSLHLLFCLYAAIKDSQLYQANNGERKSAADNYEASDSKENTADQLVLD